jgi:hypothetical protein
VHKTASVEENPLAPQVVILAVTHSIL